MVDARSAVAPNHSVVFIPFHHEMRAPFLAAAASVAILACAPAATPARIPETPQPSASPVGPFRMDSSLTPDRVPPFRETPLIEWGPPPEGVPHAERLRTYDLRHQITTVRFDWPRHAVVGVTTMTIAGRAGAAPLSKVLFDAGDMTFKRISAGPASLKHDYDGRTLTVHLAKPLRSGQSTSIRIEYDAANRTKGAYFRPAKHVVWTQGETEDTRYWVPTYDYPNDKTTWEFYIWTAKGERALSNGRLSGSRTVGDSIEWHWVLDKPASTYLMTDR